MKKDYVNIIGAGFAGCEAAYYLANKGVKVKLYEQRPIKETPAHKTANFAELVCSNTFRNNELNSGPGILKAEMRMLNSIVMQAANLTKIEAGSALAVDRNLFSEELTNVIKNHENITVIYGEVEKLPEGVNIIASGPLTSESLSKEIGKLTNEEYLYFYDAASPIITKESIDFDKVYYKNRWEDGKGEYINCPMSKEIYLEFYNELITADFIKPKEFELKVFEGCMPVEVMAKRGIETLLFGPLKPVGLDNPLTKEKYHAVVQLRQDDAIASLYNMVGFQTNLRFGEQERIIKKIPGLENAEIVRFGVMHKNTFINSPKVLNKYYQLKSNSDIFFAGQITGVEGYIESAASGILCGINVYKYLKNKDMIDFGQKTMVGSMANYIANASESNFQPMNANFGIISQVDGKGIFRSKKDKHAFYAERALQELKLIINEKL